MLSREIAVPRARARIATDPRPYLMAALSFGALALLGLVLLMRP